MSSVVIWRPEALNAKLVAAARPAAAEVMALARGHAPATSIAGAMFLTGTSTNFQIGTASPLGAFFEYGTEPHEIEAKKGVSKLADGSFVSGPIQHPGMKEEPFLRPVLPFWAPLYRRNAAGAFRGF